MLYKILLDAPNSNYDHRQNPGLHVDGIVGSADVKSSESVTSHLKELSLKQCAGGPTSSVSSNATQSADVHSMQSSTDPNGNQQHKKKRLNNNRKGGKNNNKPKDNGNNEKMNNNVGEGKKERRKVKFPLRFIQNIILLIYVPNLWKL